MKQKKLILVSIIILIICSGIIIFINNSEWSNSSKSNIKDLKISSEKVSREDKTIIYSSIAQNISKKDLKIKNIKVILKNKNGKEIVTITNQVNRKLKPSETIKISSNTLVSSDDEVKKIEYKMD